MKLQSSIHYFGMCYLFILSICPILSCRAQERSFVYKKISSKMIYVLPDSLKDMNGMRGAFDLTKMLPIGYVTNGTKDYTQFLQKGIDIHENVVFPNFPVMVNAKGIKLRSNTRIYFNVKSKLILKPNDNKSYKIFLLQNVKNITIFNPVIVGDRKRHSGTKGEWGMGFSILGSKNIKVVSPRISECWGDGIYISHFNNIPSDHIKIYNGIIDYNRRNGVSIISATNVSIYNTIFSNSYGASPMSGIDIEPNSSLDSIDNILIDNCTTFNNAREGILIVLTRIPRVDIAKRVNISIIDHVDQSSYSAVRIGSGFRKSDRALLGAINFENCKWIDNVVPIRVNKNYDILPKTNFKNINVQSGNSRSDLKINEIKRRLTAEKNITFIN